MLFIRLAAVGDRVQTHIYMCAPLDQTEPNPETHGPDTQPSYVHLQVLFLFSIGITKGKWGTLLSALLAFRADYERCVDPRFELWGDKWWCPLPTFV